jgi:hypothetical protein
MVAAASAASRTRIGSAGMNLLVDEAPHAVAKAADVRAEVVDSHVVSSRRRAIAPRSWVPMVARDRPDAARAALV